jgi:integrase
VTPQQIERARSIGMPSPKRAAAHRRVSEAIDAFMRDRSRRCKPDQARRIAAGCDLFAELMDNPRLADVDRDMVRRYCDVVLPTVPANENKIRLIHRTKTVLESIKAVEGTDWPTISKSELAKRMQWLCAMFAWLRNEGWIDDDPAAGLASAVRPLKRGPERLKRDLYTREDLQLIFAADWFKSGRGELTRAGTYREFIPYYYWLPLLGLYTGARINELCQLSLADLRQTEAGTWFFDVTEDDSDGEKKARLKNASSFRQVPVHPHLIELGLLRWRERLENEGFEQLFPELRFDAVKGYSKDAVKWYSRFAKSLGWERNGKKVFHSFRHTLASECLNELRLSEAETAQISGHQRSTSVLGSVYRKDVGPDQLAPVVARLEFGLPHVAPFDIDEGIKALRDAKQRRRSS